MRCPRSVTPFSVSAKSIVRFCCSLPSRDCSTKRRQQFSDAGGYGSLSPVAGAAGAAAGPRIRPRGAREPAGKPHAGSAARGDLECDRHVISTPAAGAAMKASRPVVTFTDHPRRWLGAALAGLRGGRSGLRTAVTAAGFALVGSCKSPLRIVNTFSQGLYVASDRIRPCLGRLITSSKSSFAV